MAAHPPRAGDNPGGVDNPGCVDLPIELGVVGVVGVGVPDCVVGGVNVGRVVVVFDRVVVFDHVAVVDGVPLVVGIDVVACRIVLDEVGGDTAPLASCTSLFGNNGR